VNRQAPCPHCQGPVPVGPRREKAKSPECGWIVSRRSLLVPGILLPVAVTALAVLLSGCGGGEPPAPPQPAPPPEPAGPPPPQPISLGELSPVALDPGGRATVQLSVERNGNEGAIQVQIAGLPEGVSAAPVEIPAGESAGQLEVAADEKLGDNEVKATATVTVKVGEMEAEQPLALVVNKLSLPSFSPAAPVILQPGTKKTVELTIERNGYEGPLELRVEGAPEKVTATVGKIAADQSATKLEIAAAADAPDASQPVRVVATLFGRTIEAQVPVQVDKSPFLVKSFMAVTLRPGEAKQVDIPVERRSYKGPLSLEVVDLPEGVTAPKVEVAADQATAALQLTAAAEAKEGVCSAKVVSTGGQLTRTDPLIVRVSLGESGFLPKEIAANPDSLALSRRGSFGGRLTTESKTALINAYGGTRESEQAVLRGLRWLAAHQQADGSWSLKEYWRNVPGCNCYSEVEKEVEEYGPAGTAFGVLPFLGAGVTHNGGPDKPIELVEYRKVVFNAVASLTRNQIIDNKDAKKSGNLGGNMYAHALGTMALCEAYGLSGDERLKVPAQLAVKYLAESQHKDGGWRYGPNQPGDMSATGWVFFAIRAGQLAGLPIGHSALLRAERFVDSCAVGPAEAKFSRYAYQPPTPEKDQPEKLTLTAAGLLTRQYLGWDKDNPDLVAGCRYLAQNLPPESAPKLGQVYYYHYAIQVLHHMEGPEFDLWNHRMREHLIRTQETEGHKAGSWDPNGTDWGTRAGRMYATGMALLTLEVYYRHLPMYRPIKRTAQ